MAEEEKVEQQQQKQNEYQQYIDAIAELKSNTVSKSDYEKLKEENKTLVNTLVNGGEYSTETPAPEKKSIEELRKELYYSKKDFSNLEYVEKTLELRNRVLEETGIDPFVGRGKDLTPTQADYEAAQKVADVFQECIDYADGDSAIFTQELMRRTIDVGLPRGINKSNK